MLMKSWFIFQITPTRKHLTEIIFLVLATTRYEQLKGIIENARKQRAEENDFPED